MNAPQIVDVIPHRPPFLLVDEIIEYTDSEIKGIKVFTGEEDFFTGHYPDYPLVPGVLLCESAMQCGAYLLGMQLSDAEGILPVATGMNNVRFKRMVRPGDTIHIEAKIVERIGDTFFLKARICVDGKLAVRLEFICTAVKSAEPVPAKPR